MIDYLAYFLISLGVFFIFLSASAILRFSDFRERLCHLVKFASFGLICVMAGVFLSCGISAVGFKALLACSIMLVTLPIEAQLLMKTAAKQQGIPGPKTKSDDQDGTNVK